MKSFKFKFVVLMAIALLSFERMLAQNIAFGPKIGFNYSSLPSSSSYITNNAGNAGLQIGLFLRSPGRTYLQTELLFGSNSASFNYTPKGIANGVAENVHFTTMDIPVLIGTKFLRLPAANIRGMLGPDFAYQLKTPGLQIPNGNYNNSAIGFILGLGVDIGAITIDSRYNFGLTNVNSGLGQKLNAFNLSVGFKII